MRMFKEVSPRLFIFHCISLYYISLLFFHCTTINSIFNIYKLFWKNCCTVKTHRSVRKPIVFFFAILHMVTTYGKRTVLLIYTKSIKLKTWHSQIYDVMVHNYWVITLAWTLKFHGLLFKESFTRLQWKIRYVRRHVKKKKTEKPLVDFGKLHDQKNLGLSTGIQAGRR